MKTSRYHNVSIAVSIAISIAISIFLIKWIPIIYSNKSLHNVYYPLSQLPLPRQDNTLPVYTSSSFARQTYNNNNINNC